LQLRCNASLALFLLELILDILAFKDIVDVRAMKDFGYTLFFGLLFSLNGRLRVRWGLIHPIGSNKSKRAKLVYRMIKSQRGFQIIKGN